MQILNLFGIITHQSIGTSPSLCSCNRVSLGAFAATATITCNTCHYHTKHLALLVGKLLLNSPPVVWPSSSLYSSFAESFLIPPFTYPSTLSSKYLLVLVSWYNVRVYQCVCVPFYGRVQRHRLVLEVYPNNLPQTIEIVTRYRDVTINVYFQ